MLESAIESLDLENEVAGVIAVVGSDFSETGGDGGVGVSETVDEVDLVGGVAIVGEDAVVVGECSDTDDWGLGIPWPRDVGFCIRCRSVTNSACRSLSCMISASTLRSESSSRRRCVSIRSDSRSCSPTLISSSNMTPLSIATLYFDSKSSSDELVFRACLSKSSFTTSISRSFSCIVLFVSRSVVISF